MNHPYKWTLEQLRDVPLPELLKYVRDDLVEGVPPQVVDPLVPGVRRKEEP